MAMLQQLLAGNAKHRSDYPANCAKNKGIDKGWDPKLRKQRTAREHAGRNTARTKPVCESLAWDKCPRQQSRSKQESNGSKANQKAEPHRECVL